MYKYLNLIFFVFLFYGHKCFANMYVCVPHICLVLLEAKKWATDPLEWELQVVVSSRKRTHVLWKGSKHS